MFPSSLKLIDTSRLLEFVLARQKEDGGFGATPKLPATLQDTFYAIDILATIKTDDMDLTTMVDPDRLENFFHARLSETPELPWIPAWFLHRSRLALNIPPAPIIPTATPTSAEEFYYRREMFPKKAWSIAANYPLRTCREKFFNLLLRRKNAGRDELKQTAAWFQLCRNHDGGFGFFPGTTSYIENSHFCLAGLATAGFIPRQDKTIENFIVFCQTAAGGFSRGIRAAPFLDASWHAIQALIALQGSDQPPCA